MAEDKYGGSNGAFSNFRKSTVHASSVAHISDLFLYFGARIIYQTPLYVPDKDREWKAGRVPEIAPHQV